MSRARILADYVAGGTTAAEFDYMDGVTSNIQTQLTAKAPLASPTFTGTTNVSSGVTFPANHATNTLVWKITSGDYTGRGSIWNSANVSFSGVNGKAYEISVFYNARNCATTSTQRRDIQSALIVHNVTHAEGVVTSAGTLIANSFSGRYLIAASAGAACDYHYINLIGYFECGADDTYYIRVNTNYNSGTDQDIYNYMSATNPAWVIVREFPNLTITAITPPP